MEFWCHSGKPPQARPLNVLREGIVARHLALWMICHDPMVGEGLWIRPDLGQVVWKTKKNSCKDDFFSHTWTCADLEKTWRLMFEGSRGGPQIWERSRECVSKLFRDESLQIPSRCHVLAESRDFESIEWHQHWDGAQWCWAFGPSSRLRRRIRDLRLCRGEVQFFSISL